MVDDEQEWEELAALDPLWAALSEPDRKFRRWTLHAFLATGEREVELTLAQLGQFGLPERWERALDFGCGVGRITRALATRFELVVGVDLSCTMVEHARRVNATVRNAAFRQGSLDELGLGSFDLVWSVLVLQHLARDEVEISLERLTGLLCDGGVAVLQLPHATRPLHRLQLSRRTYRFLRMLGVSGATIHQRTSLTPMRMTAMSAAQVEAAITRAGGRLVAVTAYGRQLVPTPSSLYVVAR